MGENPAKAGVSAQPTARSRRETHGKSNADGTTRRLDLDLFPSLRLCVIDSDPKHWKTLLQLLRTGLGPISGRKFGLESAINFERIT